MIRKKLKDENLKDIAKEAAGYLERGEVVVYPTDTLYGLGADISNAEAVERFFSLKKRPASKPVPVLVKDIETAKKLAFIDKKQEEALNKLWPGPFTAVLDKKEAVNARLSAGTGKIGLRIPADPFCLALLEEFGGATTGSSANISGMEPGRDPEAIIGQFEEHSAAPAFFVDAGTLEEKDPSTVIDLTGPQPRILRMNQTTLKKLKDIFDDLDF